MRRTKAPQNNSTNNRRWTRDEQHEDDNSTTIPEPEHTPTSTTDDPEAEPSFALNDDDNTNSQSIERQNRLQEQDITRGSGIGASINPTGSRNNELQALPHLPHAYPVPNNNARQQALPHAYPVPNNNAGQHELYIVEPDVEVTDSENQDYHDNQTIQKHVMALYLLLIVMIVAVVGVPLSYYFRDLESANYNYNDEDASEISNSLQPTLPPSMEELTEPHQTSETFTCFRDPLKIQILEWEAFERGDDPSIPRTYHFCANSTMRVYSTNPKFFNFDSSSGDTFPLIIFRPNVNILCGEDGSFENKCTFKGGIAQIVLTESPFFVSYNLNTTTENVTIEGFRFTGTRNGVNIANRSNVTNITVKNCRFDNNHHILASLQIAPPYALLSKAHVNNCTFESNIYFHSVNTLSEDPNIKDDWLVIRNIGVILSLPMENPDSIVEVYISNNIFSNNSFLTSSPDEDEGTNNVVASIINLIPPVVSVSVIDNYFKGNTNYSSGLIIVGKDDNTTLTQKYSGNQFEENLSSRLYNDSCILMYQSISRKSNGLPISLSLEEGCVDYYL